MDGGWYSQKNRRILSTVIKTFSSSNANDCKRGSKSHSRALLVISRNSEYGVCLANTANGPIMLPIVM